LAEIWWTQDRLGREVVFTLTGRNHILDRHDDMMNLLDEVRPAIEEPDYVTRDAEYPHRENHYRQIPSMRRFIKVVVAYRPEPLPEAWAGEVITAYIVRKLKPKESLLWP
jgi:hypothetical protein